jgi:hypothetical protein
MSITLEQLNEFREYAEQRLTAGSKAVDMVELAAEWQFQHESKGHFKEDILAVRASLREMDAGETGRPMSEFLKEFEERHQVDRKS